MIMAVASGKGGTGKTTLATGLARALVGEFPEVALWDCDVEAPDASLFLHPDWMDEKEAVLLCPEVAPEVCSGCGACAEACQFHALMVFNKQVTVFPELCHGCGSCALVCPEQAIAERPRSLGILQRGGSPAGIRCARGKLDIGQPLAVPVISQLKRWQSGETGNPVIIDAPPGASCPVVESMRGSDAVILVTEPTPFGLHDLKQIYRVTQALGLVAGVVINRDGVGDQGVEDFCRDHGLPVLMRIPYDPDLARGLASGKTLVDIDASFEMQLRELFQRVKDMVLEREGR